MKKLILSCFVLLLISCSSSKIVEQYKSPDNPTFEANKVLIIGMAQNVESRRMFEKELAEALEKKNIIAVKSVAFFENSFASDKKSETDLNAIEKQLADAGFDAIILSKVISSENKISIVKALKNIDKSYTNFRDDYYKSQDIYFNDDYLQESKTYHTETTLYCICPTKERELIWKGTIDIINPVKAKTSIGDYVSLLLKEFEKQQLLIVE